MGGYTLRPTLWTPPMWSWRRHQILLLLLTLTPPTAAAWAAPPTGRAGSRVQLPAGDGLGKGPLTLSAGKLRLNAKERRLELSDGVRVRLGELRLRSATLTASLGAEGGDGKVKEMVAQGRVEVSLGKSRGRAGKARIDPSGGVLELSEDPSLQWAPLGLTLKGRTIRLELRSGLLTVEEAQVSLTRRAPLQATKEASP